MQSIKEFYIIHYIHQETMSTEISPQLLKEIQAIQVRTNYLVNDIMAGEYETAFKGRGMEFSEVREYQPGDDVRSIDWNVTARTGVPHLKEFKEERELTVMLLVDVSSSGHFGSKGKLKNEAIAEIASILAFVAIKNNDKVGLVLFSDRILQYIPPKKGKAHIWMVIRSVLSFDQKEGRRVRRGTDIDVPLEFLRKVRKRKTVSFLISDFLDEGFEKNLKIAKQKHDIVAIRIIDPVELELPAIGFVELEDAETGERVVIDTSSKRARNDFTMMNKKRSQSLQKLFRSVGVDMITLYTDRSFIPPLLVFFKMREKRMV